MSADAIRVIRRNIKESGCRKNSLIREICSLKENGIKQRNDIHPGGDRARTARTEDAGPAVQHRQPDRLHQAQQGTP